MNKNTHSPDHNVVQIPTKKIENRKTTHEFPGAAAHPALAVADGGPNDPRMHEALRLAKAFLAIEDAAARNALVVLAEQLVSQEYRSRTQKR